MIEKESLVEIGKFQRTHALNGELNAILDIPEEYIEDGNPIIVDTEGIPVPYYAESIRPKGTTSFLIKLEGVDSIEDATEFVNSKIFVPRDVLKEYIDDDMLFDDELEGFRVIDLHVGEIGELEYIDDATQNQLMVVRGRAGNEIYIPLVDDFITDIDEDARVIHTTIPDGLLDLNRKSEEE